MKKKNLIENDDQYFVFENKPNLVTMSLRIDESIRKALEVEALEIVKIQHVKVTLSCLITEAIKRYLEESKARRKK